MSHSIALKAVDASEERALTRMLVGYTLHHTRRVETVDELPVAADVLPLDRFSRHYADGADHPRLFARTELTPPVISTADGSIPLASLSLFGVIAPHSGTVAVLEFEVDVDLVGAIGLLQQTCFERETLTINGAAVTQLMADCASPEVRLCLEGSHLDRDVHQLVFPGERLRDALHRTGNWSEGSILRIVYREDSDFDAPEGTVGRPGELNRPRGAICRHGRGVTVLSGWPAHVEYAVALTAFELIAASARLRKIRGDAGATLRGAEAAASLVHASDSRGLSKARTSLAGLSRRLGDLELQLSFGVESYLDGLRVPEIVLESYRASLATTLALPKGVSTTGGMLSRLKTVLDARRAVIADAEQRVTEIRRRGREAAILWVTTIAVPLGLILAFLAAGISQVQRGRSIWDWGHYLPYYLGILGVIGFAIVIWSFWRVVSARRIPRVLSEVE